MADKEYIYMKSDPLKPAMRLRKDGQLDRRYKVAKKIIAKGSEGIWVDKPKKVKKKNSYIGKPMPKRKPVKKENFLDKVFKFFGLLTLIAMGYTIATDLLSNEFDASLYITPPPRHALALEMEIEASKAYLENPRTIEETKDYMRYKFGDNYKIACMVAYSEGLVSNWTNKTPFEYSAGTFQINLAGAYGHGWKVHWDKVPGETLEAKETWLKVRKNNVDLAYKMSKEGTDWGQWSGYTNGSYLVHEDKCL